ncbi:hypothetical protein ACJX0J_037387, partial [Zea mays]
TPGVSWIRMLMQSARTTETWFHFNPVASIFYVHHHYILELFLNNWKILLWTLQMILPGLYLVEFVFSDTKVTFVTTLRRSTSFIWLMIIFMVLYNHKMESHLAVGDYRVVVTDFATLMQIISVLFSSLFFFHHAAAVF